MFARASRGKPTSVASVASVPELGWPKRFRMPQEIAACAQRENCDLIAMATHGHRGISDVLRGSVANGLRHISMVPVLMVRAKPGSTPTAGRPAA